MKVVWLKLLLILLLFVSCGDNQSETQNPTTSDEPETVDLKLNLNQGDSIVYYHEMKEGGRNMDEFTEIYKFLLVVKEVDAKGNFVFLVDLLKTATTNAKGNKLVEFSPDNTEKDYEGENLQLFREISVFFNKKMKLKVSNRLKLLEDLRFADGNPLPELLLDMNKIFIEFPEHALTKGDSWDLSREINDLGKMREDMNFKVVEVEPERVQLAFKEEMYLGDLKNSSSKAMGFYIVDRTSGLITSAEYSIQIPFMGKAVATMSMTKLGSGGSLMGQGSD